MSIVAIMSKRTSKKSTVIVLLAVILLAAAGLILREHFRYSNMEKKIVTSYAHGAYASYQSTLEEAVALKSAINLLLEQPNEETLKLAREAWMRTHNTYSTTEALRFYGGPIDRQDSINGITSPEPRLNATLSNEAYIDYVEEDAAAGIINGEEPITKAMLLEKAQGSDVSNVTTGFHVIEFLLWGQDLSADTPGERPASDFKSGSKRNEQRREYLRTATDILIEDLQYLVDSWKPGSKDNYAYEFTTMPKSKALEKILSGLAILSDRELAENLMNKGLKSGNPKDEPSPFSDNSADTYRYTFKGIKGIYYANYGSVAGFGINALLEREKPELAKEIATQIDETEKLIDSIPSPVDREVIASLPGSPGRYKMELSIRSLKKLSELFKAAEIALGIAPEGAKAQ